MGAAGTGGQPRGPGTGVLIPGRIVMSVPPPTEPVFDRSTEDVGNIVEFGHVNIRVPDQQLALIFYVMGLGLTRDPYLVTGVDNAWINVGTCQFHLPVGPAQVLRGAVGLVMQDLDGLEQRLAAVSPAARHAVRVRAARRDGAAMCAAPGATASMCTHRMPPASAPWCWACPRCSWMHLAGSVDGIARFYAQVMGARVERPSAGTVRVPIGLGESLVFTETDQPLAAYDGHHIQVAVADFSGVHRRLLQHGLITEESNQSQYRFVDIVDPDSGAVLLALEHEVRSMRHPMYARALVNRDPGITNSRYATGHEAGRWVRGPQ
jgi:catechol 2,3-dioxygenase-like lactoylglutathione lyase family enzyme